LGGPGSTMAQNVAKTARIGRPPQAEKIDAWRAIKAV